MTEEEVLELMKWAYDEGFAGYEYGNNDCLALAFKEQVKLIENRVHRKYNINPHRREK